MEKMIALLLLLTLSFKPIHRPAMPTLAQYKLFNHRTDSLRTIYSKSAKDSTAKVRLGEGIKRELKWLSQFESKSKFDK